VDREAQLAEGLAVALALHAVVPRDGGARLGDAARLEQLDGVELRGMAEAAHPEAGVVGERLDVPLARDDRIAGL
jgi:hypothetical protein